MATVRFARLIFQQKLNHYNDDREAVERRKERLLEVIDYHTRVNSLLESSEWNKYVNRGDWGFGDVDHEGSLIWGNIGKGKEEENTVRDEQIEGFRHEDREDNDIAFFLIDVESSVVAYEYRRNVGSKAPVRIIEGVFNTYHGAEEELTTSVIVNKHEVDREVSELDRITELRFVGLKPTNPDSTNHSKDMDEFLRQGGIDKMNIEAEGDDGIELENTPLLNSSLGLAEEGYGRADIIGKNKDGEVRRVRTDGSPITSEMDGEISDDNKRRRLYDEIMDTLEEIGNYAD